MQVDFNVDDTWQDLNQLLAVLCRKSGGAESDCLDLSECRYLGPYAAAAILAFWELRCRQGMKTDVILPTEPSKLDAFCGFSGMKHFLHKGRRPNEDHADSETVPLRYVYSPRGDIGSPLIRLLNKHMMLSRESEQYLRLCLQEVVQNVSDHASSSFGGIWNGRYIHMKGEVRVACVDGGVGILQSLRSRYDIESSSKALELVFEGGHTSRSRPNNMGLGVSQLVLWVRQMGGVLSVVTGNAVGIVDSQKELPEFIELDYDYQGTGVFFRVPVEDEQASIADES